jgi:hypothetical protein
VLQQVQLVTQAHLLLQILEPLAMAVAVEMPQAQQVLLAVLVYQAVAVGLPHLQQEQ